jgi:mannose-6-phosphate isomerase-like protein (cupin superfamily)
LSDSFGVKRRAEARVFQEGLETCREYFATGTITVGSSSLQPGETGAIDPGHPQSEEVFFVAEGRVRLRDPSSDTSVDLDQGDAALIPEGVPHELTNIGQTPALVTWSAAPSPA